MARFSGEGGAQGRALEVGYWRAEGEGRARWRHTGEKGEDRGEGIGRWVARCDGCGSEGIGRCRGVRREGGEGDERKGRWGSLGLGLEGHRLGLGPA